MIPTNRLNARVCSSAARHQLIVVLKILFPPELVVVGGDGGELAVALTPRKRVARSLDRQTQGYTSQGYK